jgi:DNA-binding NarL/FixJ family response regulator
MHDNEQFFFEALKVGASGYVLKTAAEEDLVSACRAALRGEPFLYPGAVRALIRDFLDRARGGGAARGSAHAARAGGGQADRRGALVA